MSGKASRARRKARLKAARKEQKRLKYQMQRDAGKQKRITANALKKPPRRRSTYVGRWGHPREHIATHPRREARKQRAYERGGCQPACTKHEGCKK